MKVYITQVLVLLRFACCFLGLLTIASCNLGSSDIDIDDIDISWETQIGPYAVEGVFPGHKYYGDAMCSKAGQFNVNCILAKNSQIDLNYYIKKVNPMAYFTLQDFGTSNSDKITISMVGANCNENPNSPTMCKFSISCIESFNEFQTVKIILSSPYAESATLVSYNFKCL